MVMVVALQWLAFFPSFFAGSLEAFVHLAGLLDTVLRFMSVPFSVFSLSCAVNGGHEMRCDSRLLRG
jgi:hypothetical protein